MPGIGLPTIREQPHRTVIISRGDGDYPLDTKNVAGQMHHSPARFQRKTLRSEGGEKREADVDVLQDIALHKTADADALSRSLGLHQIQTETVGCVTGAGPIGNVLPRIIERAGALIADESDECRIVQQL